MKAKQRKTQSFNTDDIRENNDEEPLHRIDLIDKEIGNYGSKANVIRSQNETLNTIFQEGR